MTGRYTKLNVDLSKNQVSKLVLVVKKGASVSLRLNGGMINNGQNELYLTNTQINKIRTSEGSMDFKLSKTQLKELIQRGGFLGILLGKIADPLMGLTKNVLLPLGLTVAVSAADAGIQKKIHGGASCLIGDDSMSIGSKSNHRLCINSDELGDMLKILGLWSSLGCF